MYCRTKHVLVLCLTVLAGFSSFAQPEENIRTQWTANWSSDGQYIAAGGVDGILRIFDGDSYELIKADTLGAWIHRVRWHPFKNVLALAGDGNISGLYDIENDKFTSLEVAGPLPGRAIEWNTDGTLIAVADYSGVLSIWNEDGNPIRVIRKNTTKSYVAVDWRPNSDEVIALEGVIRVYDTDGDLLQELQHREEEVLMLCVEWHPSGEFLVIGDYGDYDYDYPAVLQFRNPDMTLRDEIQLSLAEYRNLSWNLDGTRLATASDVLRIWNTKGRLLHTSISDDLLWGVDWSPDGDRIVTSSDTGKIRIWTNDATLITEIKY